MRWELDIKAMLYTTIVYRKTFQMLLLSIPVRTEGLASTVHILEMIQGISFLKTTSTARDFYDRLAFGGIEEEINSNTWVTRMADGTVITFRITSHSDGTPAVNINVDRSSQTGSLKTHKIHFVKEGS